MKPFSEATQAFRDFNLAVRVADEGAERLGLSPKMNDEGELVYDVQQGLRSACDAQKSARISAEVQPFILHRLDRNFRLLWVAIALLAYIAYRVT